MKGTTALILLSASAIALLGYALGPSGVISNQAATGPSEPPETEQPTGASGPAAPTGSITAEAAGSDADSASPFETVHGLRVRKDRNCTIERRYVNAGDGTVVEAFTCVREEPRVAGPYETYDDEALAQMAYSDPLAAEVLGKRLVEEDPQRAYDLLVRSVALNPQTTHPILWLAAMNYSLISVGGKPAIEQMSENYVLSRLAEELGTPGAAAGIRSLLDDAGLEDVEFKALEAAVRRKLQTISEIQIEVNGESSVPELSL